MNPGLEETNDNLDKGKTALQEYADAAKSAKLDIQALAVQGLKGLEDALVGVIMKTNSMKDAFRSMALAVVKDLIRIQVQRSITGPLADALAGFFPSPSSGVSPKAMGGHVSSNRPYMVGERGPELMIPGASGTIIPNNKLGGGGVTVNQTINLSTGVSQTVRTEVMNMLPQIADAAKGAVIDAKRRGGTFGAAFGS